MLLLILSVGVLFFLLASYNLYFPNSYLNTLYPKSFSRADDSAPTFLTHEIRGIELADFVKEDPFFTIDEQDPALRAEKEFQIEESLHAISNLKFNTVKLVFNPVKERHANPRQNDIESLDQLIRVIKLAEDNNLKVWLSFNGVPPAEYFQDRQYAQFSNSLFLTENGSMAMDSYLKDVLNYVKSKVDNKAFVAIEPYQSPVLRSDEWPLNEQNLELTKEKFNVGKKIKVSNLLYKSSSEISSNEMESLLNSAIPKSINRWNKTTKEVMNVPIAYEQIPEKLLAKKPNMYVSDKLLFGGDDPYSGLDVDIVGIDLDEGYFNDSLSFKDLFNGKDLKELNKPVLISNIRIVDAKEIVDQTEKIKRVTDLMVESCAYLPQNPLQRGWIYSPWRTVKSDLMPAYRVISGSESKNSYLVGYQLSPINPVFNSVCP